MQQNPKIRPIFQNVMDPLPKLLEKNDQGPRPLDFQPVCRSELEELFSGSLQTPITDQLFVQQFLAVDRFNSIGTVSFETINCS